MIHTSIHSCFKGKKRIKITSYFATISDYKIKTKKLVQTIMQNDHHFFINTDIGQIR